MNTTFESKSKRCKSQSYLKVYHQQEKSEDKKHQNKVQNQHTSKRCLCCQSKNKKYPDYLQQLRKMRTEKEKVKLPETMIISNISLKQSFKLSHEIMLEQSPLDKQVLADLSNKVSEYQHTPGKSILQQFHESIIKSHLKSSLKNTSKKDDQKQERSLKKGRVRDDLFRFTVSLQRIKNGQVYVGRFIGKQIAEFIIKLLQKLFQANR